MIYYIDLHTVVYSHIKTTKSIQICYPPKKITQLYIQVLTKCAQFTSNLPRKKLYSINLLSLKIIELIKKRTLTGNVFKC